MGRPKTNSPLLGYNTNVRHAGVLFHIQTEDSGASHPHVITHLFTEGTILSTKKTSYSEIVGVDDLEDQVRQLMKEQHKAMFTELRDGVHDEIASQILGRPIGKNSPTSSIEPDEPSGIIEVTVPAPTPGQTKTARTSFLPVDSMPKTATPAPSPPVESRSTAPSLAAKVGSLGNAGPTATSPRASSASIFDLGPPRGAEPPLSQVSQPASPARKGPDASGVKVIVPSRGQKDSEKARPPSEEEAKGRKPPQARSIFETPGENGEFGESLISDKSLDEVILSYLTEEETD